MPDRKRCWKWVWYSSRGTTFAQTIRMAPFPAPIQSSLKLGVCFMARDANIPVMALAAHGIHQSNSWGTYPFTPGEMTMSVGAQSETTGRTDDEVHASTERTHAVGSECADLGAEGQVRRIR